MKEKKEDKGSSSSSSADVIKIGQIQKGEKIEKGRNKKPLKPFSGLIIVNSLVASRQERNISYFSISLVRCTQLITTEQQRASKFNER